MKIKNKIPNKKKNVIETILVVIATILVIPLLFTINTGADKSTTEPNQPVIVPEGIEDTSNVVKPKQPPACTFPLAQMEYEESTPEEYIFSEPQVVLTAPSGIPYEIVEWLPDSQQVLITEVSDKLEMGKPRLQYIELYNSATDELKVYAIRTYVNGLPSWQPELNAVVYPSMNFIGIDKNTYHPIFTRQLWVSYGDPNTVQMLADNMSQFPIAIKPDGSEMFYLADKKLSKLDKSLEESSSSTLFDPTQWDYRKEHRNQEPLFYEMAWQPNTSLVFLYSDGSGLKMGGYTFILNTSSGQICELDLSGWATNAHWSSDGRYLAIIRATEYTSPVSMLDMTILDTGTGDLFTNEVIPQSTEGEHYLYDFTWAPDNRHLLVVGSASSQNSQNDNGIHELYLVDFISSKVVSILPDYSKFFSSGLTWSPDGSKLAIRCPIPTIGDRVCLISIQEAGK